MKQTIKALAEVVLYLIVFLLIQALSGIILSFLHLNYSTTIVLSSAISSIATILLFVATRWAKVNIRQFFGIKASLVGAICLLSITIIPPLQYVEDLLSLDFPDTFADLFRSIMQHKAGYLIVGILAPITEELVFRAAILNKLLCTKCHLWTAITVSALLFSAVHGNLAQDFHAFIVGILLGWIYARTRTILPCLIIHWVNNTIVFLLFKCFPDSIDMSLQELFNGNTALLYTTIATSTVLTVGTLWVIARLLPRYNKDC